MLSSYPALNSPARHPQTARGARIFRHLTKGLLLVAVSLLVTEGCSHGKVRNGVYLAPEERYRISMPDKRWKRVSGDGADLVLTSREAGASILTSTLCGRYTDAGLDVLSRNLFLGMRDRRILERGTVALPAGEAERLQVQARLDGTVFRAEAYTLRRDGCIYDFVYLSLPESFDESLPLFRTMMNSLRLGDESLK